MAGAGGRGPGADVDALAGEHACEQVSRLWLGGGQQPGQVDARLTAARMTAAGRLTGAGIDMDAVLRYTRAVRQAVADGLIGYQLLTGRKPI